jgi:hypothetical protein
MNALDGKKINEVGHDDFVEYIREKYKWIVSEKSLQKLKETKLWAGSFRWVLRTIAPIIKEFTNQYAANDDENIPHVLSEVSQQVSNLIKKAA